jgi:hypothetical protein
LQSWTSSDVPIGPVVSGVWKIVLYSPLVLIALWKSPAAVGEAI